MKFTKKKSDKPKSKLNTVASLYQEMKTEKSPFSKDAAKSADGTEDAVDEEIKQDQPDLTKASKTKKK